MDPCAQINLFWQASTFVAGLFAIGGIASSFYLNNEKLKQADRANELAEQAARRVTMNWDHIIDKVSVLREFHRLNNGRSDSGVGKEIGLDANATLALFEELEEDRLLSYVEKKGRWYLTKDGLEFFKRLCP